MLSIMTEKEGEEKKKKDRARLHHACKQKRNARLREQQKKQHATIHAPETVVVKSETS